MGCTRCGTYWICDSRGPASCTDRDAVPPDWHEVGEFDFEAGDNTVWCTPGANCAAKVQDADPGGNWKDAGTITLQSPARGTVYCRGVGSGGACQVRVDF